MNEHSEAPVHSAKALMEQNNKREKVEKRKEAEKNTTSRYASDQVSLLKEANKLAIKAHIEAQESKVESEKSSKRAFWSNIIAAVSLLVARASLVVSIL